MIFTAQRKLKGFTLIELLIVIAILGILAAAVLIAINPTKRQNQAKDTVTKSDMSSLLTALQAYYTAPGAGVYPSDEAAAGWNAATNPLVENKDLNSIPAPSDNSGLEPASLPLAYNYEAKAGCTEAAKDCTTASLSWPLHDPSVGSAGIINAGFNNVWCWQSSTNKATIVGGAATLTAACPAS